MSINFTKMDSQGNDFIVIESNLNDYDLNADFAKSISSRKSIGCDQLLLINTKLPQNVSCKIFNQDGTEAQQCGNGLRAIMLFLNTNYGITESVINIAGTPYSASIDSNDLITINMGSPVFITDALDNTDSRIDIQLSYKKNHFAVTVGSGVDNWTFAFLPVFIGNLHCVVFSPESYIKRDIISSILNKLFKNRINIPFILNPNEFRNNPSNSLVIRVNERGSGWTKSCGSGASAAAAFMIKFGEYDTRSNTTISVEQEGGLLSIIWDASLSKNSNEHKNLFLTGPSKIIYSGVWDE